MGRVFDRCCFYGRGRLINANWPVLSPAAPGPAIQTRVASITLNGECVGMIRSRRKPAAWKRR